VIPDDALPGLPGETLIRDGVRDLRDGRLTIPAAVVSIAHARLRRARVIPESMPAVSADPERALYQLLRAENGDAYSRYNALIRELASFLSALDARTRRTTGVDGSRT
jgi:hypothetical protein